MRPARRHTRFLASVTSVAEARVATRAGADIIDCKDPATGALGALPRDTVRAVCGALAGRVPVSATIGDIFDDAQAAVCAAEAMAATGVDFVKVGLVPGAPSVATIGRLGELGLGEARLVGVLLADMGAEPQAIELSLRAMSRARFAGVMLDTAGKGSGSLIDHMPIDALRRFVTSAREHGLFAGLAGALRLPHVTLLLSIEPDLLGFRGALCHGSERMSALDPAALAAVRAAIPCALERHDALELAP